MTKFEKVSTLLLASLFAIFLATGCGGSGSGSGTGETPPTPTPSPTPVTVGDGETVVIGQPGLCSPGDVARVSLDAGARARFPLVSETEVCTPAKDNRKEEYTMIMYNTTGTPITFELFSPIDPYPPSSPSSLVRPGAGMGEGLLTAPATHPQYAPGVNAMTAKAETLARFGPRIAQKGLVDASVGDEVEFKVRGDRDDPDVFTTTSGVLRRQGAHINIFLDRDVPFCVAPCSGATDDTLTDVQLQEAVDRYELNIYPLETAVLGAPSDVDGDGRVNLLITPVLNRDLAHASYHDPRNVLPFDPIANAGSNEAEVIFLFAPDSLGNYKEEPYGESQSWFGYTAAQYVKRTLSGWVAFQLSKIISFNQHVFISGESAEDDWIDDGMAAVMADLAGFNIWRDYAWIYLGHPHLDPLFTSEDLDSASSSNPDYLFMLYYLQSQVDGTSQETDGLDADLQLFKTLVTSGLSGVENLEEAVDFTFDAEVETEFQAIFKDWTIAIATSGSNRTDLQQADQTAVKYYFTLNPMLDSGGPSPLGSGINDGNGSTRYGATNSYTPDGFNDVGFDFNLFHPEEWTFVENADEHTMAPGNSLYGYVAPYSAMYVRLAGLFQETQTIAIRASSGALKGFIVRRSDVAYPHVYSESVFGSIDQHPEDLQTAGPNPYWENQGFAKKIDLTSLLASTADGETSQDYLTIVGRIDETSQIKVCPEDPEDCPFVDVPDTDKYLLEIPANIGARTDAGDIAIVVRRQHDTGANTVNLRPVLAVVSSKDVPYPYVPHPIRSDVVGGTDTRQQYRWMSDELNCGDTQSTAGDSTGVNTNLPTQDCVDGGDVNTKKIYSETLSSTFAENTGALPVDGGTWDGDITGGFNCDAAPTGTGFGYGTSNLYAETFVETSPSSMGGYPWTLPFMEVSYDGSKYPDVLFARDFMKNAPSYPPLSTGPDVPEWDPRSLNSMTLNCDYDVGGVEFDLNVDSPDDHLLPAELNMPSSLAEQILTEMSRGRFASDGTPGTPEAAVLPAKFVDFDIFAIDGDSRDEDANCTHVDLGNNLNTFTVEDGEGSILWGAYSHIEPHIKGNLHNSALSSPDQLLYNPPPADPDYVGWPGRDVVLTLAPEKSYTIIVGGVGNSIGNYEIRIRKIAKSVINEAIVVRAGAGDDCKFEEN